MNANIGFVTHLEYYPMVNARTHKVGKTGEQRILNSTFRQTYDNFLQSVIQKKSMTTSDKLIFVYYLQL